MVRTVTQELYVGNPVGRFLALVNNSLDRRLGRIFLNKFQELSPVFVGIVILAVLEVVVDGILCNRSIEAKQGTGSVKHHSGSVDVVHVRAYQIRQEFLGAHLAHAGYGDAADILEAVRGGEFQSLPVILVAYLLQKPQRVVPYNCVRRFFELL